MSEANRGRGQPRRGYRRTKPATRSGAGRLWSRRAAGFLLHTFLSPPKEKCERPLGRQVPIRAGVGASGPAKGNCLRQRCHLSLQCRVAFRSPPAPPSGSRRTNAGVCACGRTKGLSSGQTIGAARTAVRSACCLPELRVANRLRRLYPLDDGELFKFNLKSSVCQRQTGLPKGNPPCVFPSFPFGNLRSPLEAIERPIGL